MFMHAKAVQCAQYLGQMWHHQGNSHTDLRLLTADCSIFSYWTLQDQDTSVAGHFRLQQYYQMSVGCFGCTAKLKTEDKTYATIHQFNIFSLHTTI